MYEHFEGIHCPKSRTVVTFCSDINRSPDKAKHLSSQNRAESSVSPEIPDIISIQATVHAFLFINTKSR